MSSANSGHPQSVIADAIAILILAFVVVPIGVSMKPCMPDAGSVI